METQAKTFAGRLGFAVEEGESIWNSFPSYGITELALYEAVRGLSGHDLAQLQTLLAFLSFGQENCDRLDTRDSFFNRVARDLNIDMRQHWRPDFSFFAKRNREQLASIAKECGYVDGQSSSQFRAVGCANRQRTHACRSMWRAPTNTRCGCMWHDYVEIIVRANERFDERSGAV